LLGALIIGGKPIFYKLKERIEKFKESKRKRAKLRK
jgi:hypothetical protein